MAEESSPLRIEGWDIKFHPLFDSQYKGLAQRVEKLKNRLPLEKLRKHRDVKMLAALRNGITKLVPQDPHSPDYQLNGSLRKYKRLKRKGLASRYRLFFRVYSEEKVIVFIWLGYPRKQGDRDDCYEEFKRKVLNSPDLDSSSQLMDTRLRK